MIPPSSSNFSSRCASRLLSRVMTVRVRVRSLNSRIGGGGTNDARTNPWVPRSASQAASETSRPRGERGHSTSRHIRSFDVRSPELKVTAAAVRRSTGAPVTAASASSRSRSGNHLRSASSSGSLGNTVSAPPTVASTIRRPSSSNALRASLYATSELPKSGSCHLNPSPK